MVPLFKPLIRPVLEYGNVRRPNFFKMSKDVSTKRIIGMDNRDYEDRLKSLNLPSLEME